MAEIKCPKCGVVLTSDDSFCPSCGAYIPVELRDQIRNNGVNAKQELSLEEDHKEKLKCPKCGGIIKSDDKFCENCGASLTNVEKSNDCYCQYCGSKITPDTAYCPYCGKKLIQDELDLDQSNNINEDIENFVGVDKVNYYKEQFANIESGKKITFNLCSFLFSGFWMFYRKIFSLGFISLAINFVINLLNLVGIFSDEIYTVISICLWVVYGLIGNLFYYKKYQKILGETKNMSPGAKKTYLREKGGTSVGMVFVFFFLIIIESILLIL